MWGFLLALLPFALLIAREWELRPDLDSSDYAQYVAHAEALVDGRPYADTGYIFSVVERDYAPRAYPPGFPLLLAAAFAVFGVSLGVAKVVALLAAAGLIVLAAVYFGRDSGWGIGAGLLLILGLSPTFLEFSVSPVSDIPFAAVVWLSILLVDREGEWTVRRALMVALVAGAAVAFRPHGLVILPALGLWGLLSYRKHRWLALLPVGVLGVAVLIGRMIVGSGALRSFPSASGLLGEFVRFDLRYHLAVFESHLYPFAGDLANDVFHVFTAAIMLIGLLEFVRRRPLSFAVSFGVMYALALGSLTAVMVRFAFPLYPLFVFGLLNGVKVVVGAVFPDRSQVAVVGFAALMALVTSITIWTTEPPLPLRADPSYRGLVEHVASRVEAGEEIRIASFLPRILALETGAPGMVLLRHPDPEVHVGVWCISSIGHLALGGFGTGIGGTAASRRAIERYPDAFSLEYRNEGFELWRIDPAELGCSERQDFEPPVRRSRSGWGAVGGSD